MNESYSQNLLCHLRPVHLLASLVVYLLGAGLARYLREGFNGLAFGFGLAWLVCVQLGFYLLGDHFQTPFDLGLFVWKPSEQRELTAGKASGSGMLYGSVALLAAGALISLILVFLGVVNATSAVLMGLWFVLFSLIVGPGISLDLSGMGEIISSVILVVVPPALAFSLQSGSLHRLLPLVIFPLFPLHLAMVILLRLSRYRDDLDMNRKTLLVRIGWIQGVFIHNLLIFSGFLLFGVAILFGLAFRVIGLVFLTLPAAIFLVWYLSRLKDGAAVRWPLLKLMSLTAFFLPAYLVTYTLWIR